MYSTIEIIEDTDPLVHDLVTLAVLKSALGITSSTEDAELQAAITHWSKLIAEELGRTLAMHTVVETSRLSRRDPVPWIGMPLVLSHYPIIEIDSVSRDGTAVTTDYFDLSREAGVLWFHIADWSEEIVTTYSAGYDLPDGAPSKLQQALIESIREARSHAASGGQDLRSVTHGDLTVGYFSTSTAKTSEPGALSGGVKELLYSFRRIVI